MDISSLKGEYSMKKLSKQDLYDILYGCTILGTGGGGELEEGLKLIDRAFEKGKEFILVDLDEVDEEAMIATPYMCGAISPITEEEEKKYRDLPQIGEEPAVHAFIAMEEYMGKEFQGVISTELGGANTAIAFYTAAMLGKYIIDADPAGRSVPELQHSTYYINNLPIDPIAVANEFGDKAIFTKVVDDFRAEALVRSLAVVSKNSIGVVDHPAKARDLKKAVIPNAISYALKIGQSYRQAKEAGENPAQKVAEVGEGILRFRGRVKEFDWKTEAGFTIGNTILEGIDTYQGDEYKIWFKNENIISWLNGTIDMTVPDLICIFNEKTKEPVTNPYFEKGMEVAVVVLPAPEEWTTERGLEVFGPKSFGYMVEYNPMKKRFK